MRHAEISRNTLETRIMVRLNLDGAGQGKFATGVPFGGRGTLPATLRDMARLMPLTAGVRRWGAAALDLAYVAAGRFDGYWERGVNSWDIAAGILLVKEAGGFVESIRPEENPVESGSLVAGNTQLFVEFSGIIRQRD